MPLPWPSIASTTSNLDGAREQAARLLLDKLGDSIITALADLDLAPYVSPLFRPWNAVVVVDSHRTSAVFTALQGGVAALRWVHAPDKVVSLDALAQEVAAKFGANVVFGVSLSTTIDEDEIAHAARVHATEVDRSNRLGRLGDLTGFTHLAPHLRALLDDHPKPEKNVFLMMRFEKSEQLDNIASALRTALAERGLSALRADDRAYSDDLWANVETYMLCCGLGIAVFEQIDQKDFNPNVSLELGFMFARRKRCLLLKERRLRALHADLVGKLYKEFDAFHIAETVGQQVTRWLEVDIGLR